MGKYDPLKTFLETSAGDDIPMSFEDVEKVLGTPLPGSQRYPAWWSNNPSNNTMTQAWLDAGFRTERVDTAARRLVFRRVKPLPPSSVDGPATPQGGGIIERLQRALAGTVRIAPGVDLTEPLNESWDAQDR
jgi:YD repeat-containing protein